MNHARKQLTYAHTKPKAKLKPGLGGSSTPSGQEMDRAYFTGPGACMGPKITQHTVITR